MKVAKIDYKKIETFEDVAKVFEALGLVLAVDYAKENDMEHLLGEEVDMPQGE